jgi:hypothetical protein
MVHTLKQFGDAEERGRLLLEPVARRWVKIVIEDKCVSVSVWVRGSDV